MYKELKLNNNMEKIFVGNKKNIIITGLNGVGKTMLLENFRDELKGVNKYFENSILLDNGVTIYDNGRQIAINSLIISGFHSNYQWKNKNYTWAGLINGQYKIININKKMQENINAKFSVFEKRLVRLFNKMQNIISKEIIKNNGKYESKDISIFGYVRAKRGLDSFLEGKVISGLDATGTKIMIQDVDGKEKWIGECLSNGEKYLFSLASILLEAEDTKKVLFWDEPENGFSPSWQRKIVLFINSIAPSAQLIIATHSTHIIAVNSKDENSIILKLERNRNGLSLSKTNVFDDFDLSKEHFLSNDILDKIRNTGKPIILVEGWSDKIILDQALDNEYEILDCEGEGRIRKLAPLIPLFNSSSKIIAIVDNDVKKPKEDKIRIFSTKLIGLDNDKTIEGYFTDYFEDDFVTEFSENIEMKCKKGWKKVEMKHFNSVVKKTGFLFGDKYRADGKELITKVEFAKKVIKRSDFKEKISDLLNYIKSVG